MRRKFRCCMVNRGWPSKACRALKKPAGAEQSPSRAECRVGDYHLSGAQRTTDKGTRVVVFKYRFGYLPG